MISFCVGFAAAFVVSGVVLAALVVIGAGYQVKAE